MQSSSITSWGKHCNSWAWNGYCGFWTIINIRCRKKFYSFLIDDIIGKKVMHRLLILAQLIVFYKSYSTYTTFDKIKNPFWWDEGGVLYYELLKREQTVIVKRYALQLNYLAEKFLKSDLILDMGFDKWYCDNTRHIEVLWTAKL